MNRISSITMFLLAAITVSSATAASLAYEGFDYGEVTTPIAGLDGGYGFSGGWVADANSTYQPGSLPVPTGYGFAPVGGSMQSISGISSTTQMYRDLDFSIDLNPAAEQVYYFSVNLKFGDATQTLEDGFVQVDFMDGSNTVFVVGKGSDDQLYIEKPGGPSEATNNLTLRSGVTYLMVLKLIVRSGADDEIYVVYYNAAGDRVIGEPSSDDWDLSLVTELTGQINRIMFSTGESNEQRLIDEIRIGESWEDVLSPEPLDSRIPQVPFDRGLFMHVDAASVWTGYEQDSTERAFVLINKAPSGDFTFGGKIPDEMPTIVPNALNGHPVLDFDGTQWMQLPSRGYMNNIPKLTMFMVLNIRDDSYVQGILRSGYDDINGQGTSHNNLWGVIIEGGSLRPYWRNKAGGFQRGIYPIANFHNKFGISSFTWDTNIIRHDSNGEGLVDANRSGADGLAQEHYRSRLGSSNAATPADFFDGQIAEMLIYNRLLTESQRRKVGAYLADKYGLDTDYDDVSLVTCEDLWRHQKGDAADFSQDCQFGVADIILLAENWLVDMLQ